MILVMESLRGDMNMRPRYWQRLLEVLTLTAQSKDTPPSIVKVSQIATVGDVYDFFPSLPEMYFVSDESLENPKPIS